MKRKVYCFLPCLALLLIMCSCSSPSGTDNKAIAPEETENIIESAEPAETPEPAEETKQTDEPASTPSPEPTETPEPKPAHEPKPAPEPTPAPTEKAAPKEAEKPAATPEPTIMPTKAPAASPAVTAAPTETFLTKTYTNVYFDYSDEIAALNAKTESYTAPAAADIGIRVSDEKGATGVVLVPSADGSQTDFYLNALVAGNKLTFSGDIASASDKLGDNITEITVTDGTFTITPQPISAGSPADEIITITKSDNTVYSIHTVNEYMPAMHISTGTLKPRDGVYSFTVDNFLLRVGTDGNIVYYRNYSHLEGNRVENFKPQDTADGRFYTVCVELNAKLRGIGFVSGMFTVMDENYKEINYITLSPNSDKNHTHGEGYLDDHEFLLLGRNHWICLSYTPMLVNNLVSGGIDGGTTAYVQACIVQEVVSGSVVHEYNSTDYPQLYAAAKENVKYDSSSGQKTPNDYMDYAHANSVFIDPKDGNLLVSYRSQYAVIKLDRETGDIIWILGGALNQFKGLEAYYDKTGNLLIGQHYARYIDKDLAGNDSTVSIFDNHTNYGANTTRVLIITLDEEEKTASAKVINGSDLDKLTALKHWSTHCASFEMTDADSCFFGWGSNVMLDMNMTTIPTHALLTDYNITGNEITFELCIERNKYHAGSKNPCFSYRVYKNAY
jgi:hypothetical protein